MIILPRRSRRKRGPRQQFAGIIAVIAALIAAGMPVLTRTFRGYPRGSFSMSQNWLPWAIFVPILVLIAVALVRVARRNDDEHRDDADAHRDTGDSGDSGDTSGSGDGQPDCDRSKKPLVFVLTIALAALLFGAIYYLSATRPG
jgi:uncharacterized membrane protein